MNFPEKVLELVCPFPIQKGLKTKKNAHVSSRNKLRIKTTTSGDFLTDLWF